MLRLKIILNLSLFRETQGYLCQSLENEKKPDRGPTKLADSWLTNGSEKGALKT